MIANLIFFGTHFSTFRIFGESVLNDSIAIVLYRTLTSFLGKDLFHWNNFGQIILKFVVLNLGSIGIGVGVALLSGAMLKRLQKYLQSTEELVVIFLFGYASYLLAEVASLSGILAIFICSTMVLNSCLDQTTNFLSPLNSFQQQQQQQKKTIDGPLPLLFAQRRIKKNCACH